MYSYSFMNYKDLPKSHVSENNSFHFTDQQFHYTFSRMYFKINNIKNRSQTNEYNHRNI